jgi:hypothetical protein
VSWVSRDCGIGSLTTSHAMKLRPTRILIVALISLSGCASDLNLKTTAHQPLNVISFNGGRETGERQIASGSPEQKKLASWLEEHRTGWKRSYITYAPGVMLVSGTNFTLNIRTTGVVLNVAGRQQFVRDASVSDFTFLLP